MSDMTVVFLERGDEVLLAMKKRGFGEGRWNGVGGKLDPGETVIEAMLRECQEEIEVTPLRYRKSAELTFDEIAHGERRKVNVHVYVCDKWQGEPTETEEMNPKWFKKTAIPYDDMWQDDRHWLPQVMSGEQVTGIFVFDDDDNLTEHTVSVVTSLQ